VIVQPEWQVISPTIVPYDDWDIMLPRIQYLHIRSWEWNVLFPSSEHPVSFLDVLFCWFDYSVRILVYFFSTEVMFVQLERIDELMFREHFFELVHPFERFVSIT
jgi:hypothetical protein